MKLFQPDNDYPLSGKMFPLFDLINSVSETHETEGLKLRDIAIKRGELGVGMVQGGRQLLPDHHSAGKQLINNGLHLIDYAILGLKESDKHLSISLNAIDAKIVRTTCAIHSACWQQALENE